MHIKVTGFFRHLLSRILVYDVAMTIRPLIYLLFVLVSTLAFLPASAADNSEQRKLYEQANKALQTHQLARYQQIRAELDDYALAPYLDYLYLLHRLDQVPLSVVDAFLSQHSDSFFGERLRARLLNKLADRHDWQNYLRFYEPTQSSQRQCYRTLALIQTGDYATAREQVADLWLVPGSQDKACDPVFKFGRDQGVIDDDLIWERLMLSLRHQQFSIAKYLSGQVDASHTARAWIERWQTIHSQPLNLLNQLPAEVTDDRVSLAHDLPLAREIILHGIKRLARRDFDKAFSEWQRLSPHYSFTDEQRSEARRTIGLWAALNRDDNALQYFGDTVSVWRVRAALWQQDWQAVQQAIAALDMAEQQTNQWQYWLGRSQAALGDETAAQATWQSIADDRDYYSFLAADRLGQEYQMNHNPIVVDDAAKASLRSSDRFQRLREFYELGMDLEARREAYHMQQHLSREALMLVATETHTWPWHNQTIAFLGRAQYWDALDLRFPLIYMPYFNQTAETVGLDASWLIAIARQESAFNPNARSHAGAMGLMQVMPATGELMGRQLNQPLVNQRELYIPERNITLGGAYLKKVFVENQRNPVLATASYNAGPHRVRNWLPDKPLPADIWAENIPFNETRHYIRAVMSYAATFDFQRKRPITPLRERMPAVQPTKP